MSPAYVSIISAMFERGVQCTAAISKGDSNKWTARQISSTNKQWTSHSCHHHSRDLWARIFAMQIPFNLINSHHVNLRTFPVWEVYRGKRSFAKPTLEDNTFCALFEGFRQSRKVFLAWLPFHYSQVYFRDRLNAPSNLQSFLCCLAQQSAL